MKASIALISFSVGLTLATPLVIRQDQVDDTTVLNFALTLEHLENAFYQEALAKFDQQAFLDASLPPWSRGRFEQIAAHEKTHVQFLSDALGDKATKPCTYEFPYTDPRGFTALSQVLEGVGTSAYTGAARLITNKDYLTAAASVLATEARHAAWVASAVNKFAAWSGDFDVPLGLNQVFTLAAPFIKSCPDSNPKLPVKAFPTLTIDRVRPGSETTFHFDGSNANGLTAVFFTGLTKKFAPITDGKATIPGDLLGQVYVVVSKSADSATDENIVAGPAIVQYEFNWNGDLIF